MHELSTDATNWVRASTYPELFTGDNRPAIPGSPARVGATARSQPGRGDAFDGAWRQWWYRKNGSEAGPVDQTSLQQALASGSISPDDMVWAEGMSQWVPARQVPGLSPAPAGPWLQQGEGGPMNGTAGHKDELPMSLCKSATNSRPWVIFLAVFSFIYGGLAVLSGILYLILGAKEHSPPVVAGGLFSLIFGVDAAAGGFLLLDYASRVGSSAPSYPCYRLRKALHRLRTFWIYVGINLIVLLAFSVFGIVWAIAVGAAVPWS